VTHPWKGNVRELRSAVEQALLLASGAEITDQDLFGETKGEGSVSAPAGRGAMACVGPAPTAFRDAKGRFVADFEKNFLVQALRRNGGNITKAAEEVGMYRQNFQQKMRELGITAEDAERSER
jgi:DNA-binding NtrC family response regulator